MTGSSPAVLGAIGLVAGIASGLFGIGGGLVIVPALVMFTSLRQHEAHASSLGAVIPIATVASIPFIASGLVDWPFAIAMSLTAMIGARAGARVMARLSEQQLRIAFIVLMLVVVVRMVIGTDTAEGGPQPLDSLIALIPALMIGFLAGIASALFGIGGGLVMVPLMAIAGSPSTSPRGPASWRSSRPPSSAPRRIENAAISTSRWSSRSRSAGSSAGSPRRSSRWNLIPCSCNAGSRSCSSSPSSNSRGADPRSDARRRSETLGLSRRWRNDRTAHRREHGQQLGPGGSHVLCDLFGLDAVMDLGWIVTSASAETAVTQISILSEGGSGAPVPEVSIEVDNVDEVYRRAIEAGCKVVHDLTDEPWGVRRVLHCRPDRQAAEYPLAFSLRIVRAGRAALQWCGDWRYRRRTNPVHVPASHSAARRVMINSSRGPSKSG